MENEIKVITSEDCQNLMKLSFCEGIEACCTSIETAIDAIDNLPCKTPIDRNFIMACIDGGRLNNKHNLKELKKLLGLTEDVPCGVKEGGENGK